MEKSSRKRNGNNLQIIFMVKKVDQSKYNEEYFQGRYKLNYTDFETPNKFEQIYQKAGSMIKLNNEDVVIDLGCGSGMFPLFLYLKYGCKITGIDYAEDAIKICDKNLENFSKKEKFKNIKNKISFILSDNENLPNFEKIKAVFLIDVIEHLFNEEIELVIEKIKSWSGEGEIYLIIHTDNKNYLRFIQPIIDFIAVSLGRKKIKEIIEKNKWDFERHVNLTTPKKLKKKLSKSNFKILKTEYPQMDIELVKGQLGSIGKYPIILYPIYFFGKILFFLRPSFYLLAKYSSK